MRSSTIFTEASAPAATVTHHQTALQQRSAWHSPVPYLFGGLAAMLGLIAFALLLLACSYWKLSGYLEGGNNGGYAGADPESGEGKPGDSAAAKPTTAPAEQRIVVIMAGEDKPTFLATPMSSRASSFGDNANKGKGGAGEEDPKLEAEAGGGDATSYRRQEGAPENQDERETQQNQNQNVEASDHQSLHRGQSG